MKRSIIAVLILILILTFTLITILIKNDDNSDLIVNNEGINKIGIISVWSDLENKSYARSEEYIIEDAATIQKLLSIINAGVIDNGVKLDRLPAEYELNIYYKDNVVKCYYWFNLSKYNFNAPGIGGEITIESNRMDNLIIGITGEVDKKTLVNPY